MSAAVAAPSFARMYGRLPKAAAAALLALAAEPLVRCPDGYVRLSERATLGAAMFSRESIRSLNSRGLAQRCPWPRSALRRAMVTLTEEGRRRSAMLLAETADRLAADASQDEAAQQEALQ